MTVASSDLQHASQEAPPIAERRRAPAPPREAGASLSAPFLVQTPTAASVEVEEFFRGVVEEIGADALRLRTVSSEGEEGVAWLPLAEIPVEERKYIALGAPVRVSVVVTVHPRQRRSEIRFLRPSQWCRPSEAAREKTAGYLLEQMQALLGRASAK